MTEDEKMAAAYEEAHRRVEEIRQMVGFADDIAAWWTAGFASGALWAQSMPAVPITDAQVEAAARSLHGPDGIGWEREGEPERVFYRAQARAALEAARAVS